MRLLELFVIFTVLLVYVLVVEGTERRTCERQIPYTVTETFWFIWKKVTLKSRNGLFCCDGYNTSVNKTHHYIEVQNDRECTPFCSPKCPANSICLPPTTCECAQSSQFYATHHANQCKCNKGFMKTENGQCSPICPDNCTNGICKGLTCTCNEGFMANEHQMCVPQCDGCAEDHECTSPGVCSPKPCKNSGYERNEMKECVPKCQHDCLNGNCTAPGNCTCNEGYQLNSDNQTCEAKCNNCTNGFCTEPQECLCNMGFKDVAGVCVEMAIAEESSEDIDASATGWLLLGVALGLVVIATVAVVGYFVTRRMVDRNKSSVEAPIALQQVPRPMLELPENDDEEICEENDLYGRF